MLSLKCVNRLLLQEATMLRKKKIIALQGLTALAGGSCVHVITFYFKPNVLQSKKKIKKSGWEKNEKGTLKRNSSCRQIQNALKPGRGSHISS